MDNPAKLRVQGGTLFLVHTRLWSQAVLPMPNNMRLSEALTYPISGGAGVAPLPEPRAADDGGPYRTMNTQDESAIIRALD